MKKTYKQTFKMLGKYMKGDQLSILEALKPYFEDYDKPHWVETATVLKSFLAEPYPLADKESVIAQYVDLMFDTKRSNPILWASTVLGAIDHQILKVEAREAAIEQFMEEYKPLTNFLMRFQCTLSYTPEEVLNDYFRTTREQDWELLARLIRQFLAEDLSRSKKVAIIQRYASIDFHYRNMPALLWLKGVANSMDYRLQWAKLL